MPAETIDILLAATLCLIAWRLLGDRDHVRAATLFIAFGLLLAIAWVRLDAPDVAVAEAAIGAGVTGLLFLDAAGRLRPRGDGRRRERPISGGRIVAGTAAALACAVGLTGAILALPGVTDGLRPLVAENVPRSGVEHPVTAVLLAFRAWDTLLEVAVLLVGIAGILAIRREWAVSMRARRAPDPLLATFARAAAPVLVLAAGYLLWLGSTGPGGAFQAGALLGALMLLLALAGVAGPARVPAAVQRAALGAGTGVFALVALGTAITDGTMLALPSGAAYELILTIETAVAVSVGAALGALVLAARPRRTGTAAPEGEEA